MTYKNQLETVSTIEQLYNLYEHLILEYKKYSELIEKEGINIDNILSGNRTMANSAHFYMSIVRKQIEALAEKGITLAKINIEQ